MAETVQDLNGDGLGARMSVVLATDSYQTIRLVVRHLGRQTVRHQLEVVIVAPAGVSLGLDQSELEGFAAYGRTGRLTPTVRCRPRDGRYGRREHR